MLNLKEIISNFYIPYSKAYNIVLSHGLQVACKAISILDTFSLFNFNVDRNFVIESAILHDIGICMTSAAFIGCYGKLPYLSHGIEGKKMLNSIGLYKHGLVCERHIGSGIIYNEVIKYNLPLPLKNMIPITFEEKLICYSDNFFSKSLILNEKIIAKVLRDLVGHNKDCILRFLEMHNFMFNCY